MSAAYISYRVSCFHLLVDALRSISFKKKKEGKSLYTEQQALSTPDLRIVSEFFFFSAEQEREKEKRKERNNSFA